MPAESEALSAAFAHARAYLDDLETSPVGATTGIAALRERLARPLPHDGTAPATVIEDLVADTAGGHHASQSGRFFAWVIGGSVEAALAADWLTSAWDQNAAMHACAPAAGIVEEVAGDWLKELLDLPREASFALTTGCQMAHFTCLAAARHAVLSARGWDVNQDGLAGAPPIRVLVGAQRHDSIDRALRFLGIGNRSIVTIPANGTGGIDAGQLTAALRSDQPTIVALAAGDLNIASFDAFGEIIPMAREAGAWVHIDGAFGLFARVSRRHRGLLAGVELADSWSADGHKWLNVPFDCGFACIRDVAAHRASMTIGASYLSPAESARDQIDWNPEWSRRARGFAVYAAVRQLGRTGLEQVIDSCCQHAAALVEGIGTLPSAEVVSPAQLNQGLVRFLDPRAGASDEDHDARTNQVLAAINASGEAFFSGTTWRGRRAMRISVVNWRTSEADVERAVAAAKAVLLEK